MGEIVDVLMISGMIFVLYIMTEKFVKSRVDKKK
jgi:hypothetical protein